MKSNVRQPLDFNTTPAEEGRAPLPALSPGEDADLAIRPPPGALQRLAPVEGENPGIGRWGYVAALLFGALWAGALIAFVAGYEGAVDFGPLGTVILGLLAVAPLGLALLVAYVQAGLALALEGRRAKAVAERRSAPRPGHGEPRGGGRCPRMRSRTPRARRQAKIDLLALRDTVATRPAA